MPLTALQRAVIAGLRPQRHPGSHVAGSIPQHASDNSLRESLDIDLFHDALAAVATSSDADCQALEAQGFSIEHGDPWNPTHRRARITHPQFPDSMEIDWVVDSAWRFHPPVADELLGWRLHDLDLACNKALALGGRSESRDLVDIVSWSERIPLAAICWAACGKDPGFNPLMLLAMMRRFARVDPGQLARLRAHQLDPVVLKSRWLADAEQAAAQITALADQQPELPIGVAFLDRTGQSCWPQPHLPLATQGLAIHHPSVGGCIPVLRLDG
jgi:hypothetical protein